MLVVCIVGVVYKNILTWEVIEVINILCSERELEVYKLGEIYPERKPAYLNAKRK